MPRILFFHVAIFVSAFLLFQIQPMIAKGLLPGFGGSYLVWGTCMAFFQGLLLLGYGFVHVSQTKLGTLKYAKWHWIALLLPLVFLPFDFDSLLVSQHQYALFIEVCLKLLASVALPFFTLSMGSILLQAWLASSDLPQRDNPYALYASSNLGSLTALLSYPLVIEPFFPLEFQGKLWAALYIVMLVFFAICQAFLKKTESAEVTEEAPLKKFPLSEMLSWILLSASGSAMLIAITNTITFDIASVPFLWTLPLSVYLFTFVLLFKRNPWNPGWMGTIFGYAVIVGTVLYLMTLMRWRLPLLPSLGLQLLILFIICMRVHGLLVNRKPKDTRQLTIFYFAMSIGGFLGTLVVSGFIPLVSTNIVEYPFSFVLAAFAIGLVKGRDGNEDISDETPFLGRVKALLAKPAPLIGMGVAALLIVGVLPYIAGAIIGGEGEASKMILPFVVMPLALTIMAARTKPLQLSLVVLAATVASPFAEAVAVGGTRVAQHRNFYGIYKVFDKDGRRILQHGTTIHGEQNLDPANYDDLFGYYHPTSPIHELLTSSVGQNAEDIGMIGLGSGALGITLKEGTNFTIFELDPDNGPIAEEHFVFLENARNKGVNIALEYGDGRVRLRDFEDGSFDIFIVDAFNSGSIPVHLLTLEAIAEYFRVLKDDGLLVCHISNRVMTLEPLLFSLGNASEVLPAIKSNAGAVHEDAYETVWFTMTKNEELHDYLVLRKLWRNVPITDRPLPKPWTDQYNNLLAVIR